MPILTVNGKEVEVDKAFLSLSAEEQEATVEEIARSLDGENSTRLESFGRGAAQGASFMLADEVAGGAAQKSAMLEAATDRDRLQAMNEAYKAGDMDAFRELQKGIFKKGFEAQDKATEEYRAADEAAAEANPGSYFLGNVGGGIATLPLTAPAMATAKLGQGAGLGARMLAGAKDGAKIGAAYGAGSSEGVEGRALGAASGAATGAVLGGVIPAAATTVKAAVKPLKDVLKARTNPRGFATQKVAERLAADGTDAAQVSARMAKDPSMSMVDVAGENTRNLLRTASNIPGKGQNRIQGTLTMRQMGQGDRLNRVIEDTFSGPTGYLTAKEKIAEVAKANASPLYERAYSNPAPFTQELQEVLNTPAGKQALSKGITIAKNEGVEIGEMLAERGADGKLTFKRIPDMRVWDYIKRGFDDVIEGQTDNLTGKVSTMGRSVVILKNKMLKQLDDANPDYAQARKIASDGFKLDDALEFGRKSMSMSAEAVKKKFAGYSEAEKQAARIGRAEAMRAKIDKGGFTHNRIKSVMGTPEQYRQLKAMFPSSTAFRNFRKAIFQEARKQRSFDRMRGNSTTAKQLIDAEDFGRLQEVGEIGKDAAMGNLGRVVTGVTRMLTRFGGITPEVADEVSKKLLSTSPQAAREIVSELQQIEQAAISAEQKAQMVRSIITRLSSAQTGQLAGTDQ